MGTLMSDSSSMGASIGVIERYRDYLPVSDTTPVISLHEGSTPLIPSPRLSSIVGRGCRVFLKYEGLNPTGSFKDRGMTVAVSKAIEGGAKPDYLRFNRKYFGIRGGVRCARWHSMRRTFTGRENRDGQTRPGIRLRRGRDRPRK